MPPVPPVCTAATGYDFFKGCWSAGHTITIHVPSSFAGPATRGIAEWNKFLQEDASAPRFAVSTSSGDVELTVDGSGGTNEWCGEFDGDSLGWIEIHGVSTCDNGASLGTQRAAFLQESAGILGWYDGLENTPDAFEPGMTTNCALYLGKVAPKVINDQVCVHEAEGVILAYRNLENTVSDPLDFWRDSVYMHAKIQGATDSIFVGDTITIVADTFYSGGFGGGGAPALVAPGGHIPIAKPTNGQVSYSSNNDGVLHRLTGGTFVAQAVGSAYLRARPSTSPSTRTRWYLPFKERGDSIERQVFAAPSPPSEPYVVTSDETPIWNAGYHEFTAHIGTPGAMVYWTVDDSRTLSINPDTSFTTVGQVAGLSVAAGSYTLRFGVSLNPGGGYGYQDIPVCTSGGGEALRMWDGGGATTDAVENCPPPGQ